MSQSRNTSAGAAEARPLTARSVIASTLLGIDPPRLPTVLLVRSGELFGLSPGTTRTAISRMAAAGELEPDGDGYRLAGRLLERHARQQASRAMLSTPRWDGRWDLAIVTVPDRRCAADRTALRGAMQRLKLAEWREGVWLRPANLDRGRHPTAAAVVEQQCAWVDARPEREPTALVAELWPLAAWRDRALADIDRILPLTAQLEAGETSVLADGFVVSAGVLRHLLADPELPAALLPSDWPGERLRHHYDRFDRAYKDLWRSWFRDQT